MTLIHICRNKHCSYITYDNPTDEICPLCEDRLYIMWDEHNLPTQEDVDNEDTNFDINL